MGVMASMDLMPVCNGSCTGLRPVMPGAWISMRRIWAPTMGPFPSMGSPRALTTRPSRASPTGIERMRPVARTGVPSSTAAADSASPRMTAPIESSSRLRARPTVPPSNSRSSFTPTSGRPETRAMPSPTSSTRPTWVDSSEGVYPSRFFLSAAVMSPVLIVSSAMTWSSGLRMTRGVGTDAGARSRR
ncbi:unannotated protein [freshwater metagenome]|uniref:Unannotated protein n=1 Tax=freshwater metagenome TaxID=449393 RepID=A0A6J5YEF3_9ZZZZ